MIRVALLTTDSREHFRHYDRARPYFGSAPAALLEGFTSLPDVEVHVISCLQRRIPCPEQLDSNLFYHGLYVPKLGWMRTGYQGCVRAVRRCVRAIQPDVVHGQGTERDCGLSAVLSGRPNVVTLHGHMRRIAELTRAKPFSYYWLTNRLENWVLGKTKGVVCITRYTEQAIRARTAQTWLIPNAVSNTFFAEDHNKAPAPVREREPLVVCIGHVSPWKNQNWLMQALNPLAGRTSIRLRFIGQVVPGDPYGQTFNRLLAARSWCQHVGLADPELIRQHLAQATVLVLPSLEENCPMVVLEAMAMGVPVVAANVGGVSDLVEDNVTGRLLPSQDAEAFSAAIETLVHDREAAERLRVKARQVAETRFRPVVVARQHLNAYQNILKASTFG